MAEAASSSGQTSDLQAYAGQGFNRALGRLGDGRLEKQTLSLIQNLCRGVITPGMNDRHLSWVDGVGGLESRYARVTQGQGAPRLIFTRDDSRIVVLWVDYHDDATAWERRNRARIPDHVDGAAPLSIGGTPPPVPRTTPDEEIQLPAPDLLRDLRSASFEEYFAALDEDQRSLVYYDMSNRKGLSFVTAGAGTGKTSIAIRRALHLAGRPELEGGRVLYLCYNRVLRATVESAIKELGPPETAGQIDVRTFHQWAGWYLRKRGQPIEVDDKAGWLRWAIDAELKNLPEEMQRTLQPLLGGDSRSDTRQPNEVLATEILHVISPNQFKEFEPYGQVKRPVGQGLRPLKLSQRRAIWALHRRIRQRGDLRYTWDDLVEQARSTRMSDPSPPRYRSVIVDEGQDCSRAMVRLAKALVAGEERRLLVLADPVQDMYPGRFVWAKSEFGPRGRQAKYLLRPYRSTRQIHALAASLYAKIRESRRELEDMSESRREGPPPRLAKFATEREGLEFVITSVREEVARGRPAGQIAVLTGSNSPKKPRRDETVAALGDAGIPALALERDCAPDSSSVSVSTVNAAKGLDFTSVYLLDPGLSFGSPDSRRARFYVAITRASRSVCIVCCTDAGSPLLEELDPKCYRTVLAANDRL